MRERIENYPKTDQIKKVQNFALFPKIVTNFKTNHQHRIWLENYYQVWIYERGFGWWKHGRELI